MINILYFALEFAPNNITGAHRSIKFVKNLRRFGINPIVVTTTAKDSLNCFQRPIDDQLMDGLDDIEIVRYPIRTRSERFQNIKLFRFLKLFFRIDEGLSSRWAVDVDHLMKTYKPEAVVVTLPPFSMWRIVARIKKSYSVPLITDMRDAWALWAPAGYFSKLHYSMTLRRERKLFRVSDRVIGVTPQLLKLFQRSHPDIHKGKFFVVNNFFESSSFHVPSAVNVQTSDNKIIRIGYVGRFYYIPRTATKITDIFRYYPLKDDWLYRSPYFFMKALSLMFEKFPELKSRVFVEFTGEIPEWLPPMVRSFGLDNNLTLHGFLKAKQSQDFQRNCDFFLATAEKIEGTEHFCLPSKLFEYVKIGKPILGFVTEGIQNEFLRHSGLGFIFDPDQFEENARRMAELFSNKSHEPMKIRQDYIMKFSDENQTKALAEIIRASTGHNNEVKADEIDLQYSSEVSSAPSNT